MSWMARDVGREIDHDWRYQEPACHFAEAQPDGCLLIQLPKLGDMDFVGEIVWMAVQPGQQVLKDQTLFEIDCLKLCVELPSPCDAIVEQVLVSRGQRIPIGEPLVVLRPV